MKPVQYINRDTGEVCDEVIFGETWLRRCYETHAGKIFLGLIRMPWFSKIYGWNANRPASKKRILPFVEELGLDPQESELPIEEYATFNDFFSRRLKPGLRPLDPDPAAFLSSADSRMIVHRNLKQGTVVPVKGRSWKVEDLLCDSELAARFHGGDCVSFRLCPSDYHRFHFPVSGTPSPARTLGGHLYSVNPIALAAGAPAFTENHRVVLVMEDTTFGCVAIVCVGATCVGTIELTHSAGVPVERGDEMGTFRFGGSAMIILTTAGSVTWDADILAARDRELEILVRYGQRIGIVS